MSEVALRGRYAKIVEARAVGAHREPSPQGLAVQEYVRTGEG